VFKKLESRAPLTWTWKKSTLTSFQGFCVLKYTRETPKTDFAMVVFGTP
jgi:hypothetical protein